MISFESSCDALDTSVAGLLYTENLHSANNSFPPYKVRPKIKNLTLYPFLDLEAMKKHQTKHLELLAK